jgi:hypothetical protein
LLASANIYFRTRPTLIPAKISRPTQTELPTQSGPTPQPELQPPPKPAPVTARIKWAPLEAEEYSTYMDKLRKFGFPEALIRQLIVSEIDALYEPRLAPLRTKVIPPDAPPSVRDRKTNAEDLTRLNEWQKTLIEKRQRLEDLLGGNVPREMIRTPISRNYDAHEYAVGLLPPEKQEAARQIIENQWLTGEALAVYPERLANFGFESQTQAYSSLYEKRNNDLQKILTHDEYDRLMMNIMPAGTELQREIVGMEPTEKELAGLYQIADEVWTKDGGVFGKWHMQHVPPEQIKQNDREAEAKIQEFLGPNRYAEYRMSRSDTGRQLKNLAARYDMPEDWALRAFSFQRALIDMKNDPPTPENEARRIELRAGFSETLGPALMQAWQRGQKLNFTVEP